MESDPRQAIDASHDSPDGHRISSSFSLEPRPEPMVIVGRLVPETTDNESRKRRRLADGGNSPDGVDGWNRDAHMALAVRVADLQAKILNITNDYKQLENINSALEIDIAELKVQAVEAHSKLRENTERHVAQLKDLEKQQANEVTDLKA